MAFDEPTSTIHQINQRLEALEAQVAYLSQALGVAPGAQAGAWPLGGQPVDAGTGYPQPAMGMPVPSSGYGSLGPGGPVDPSGGFPDVVQLARSGRKIEAVKLYRQYTNVGLKEAKAFVDSL
jgi:hypothetical protein